MECNVLVDKLKVGLSFDSAKDYEYKQVMEWASGVKKGEYEPQGKVWTNKHSLTNVNQPLEGGGNLFVRYGFQAKRFRAWLEFNPSKVCLAELEGHLSTMLHFGHGSLVQSAMLNRVEIAIDIDHVRFQDFLYLDSALTTSASHLRVDGTDYLGSPKGSRSITCYDKRKELQEEWDLQIPNERLRIEAAVLGCGKHCFRNLSLLDNPFKKLLVIQRSVLMSTTVDALEPLRAAAISNSSLQAVYRQLPKSTRLKVMNAIAPAVAPWWHPDLFWKRYQSESLTWLESWASSAEAALAQFAIDCKAGPLA